MIQFPSIPVHRHAPPHRTEAGAACVEYVIAVALISLIALIGVSKTGESLSIKMQNAGNLLHGSSSGNEAGGAGEPEYSLDAPYSGNGGISPETKGGGNTGGGKDKGSHEEKTAATAIGGSFP